MNLLHIESRSSDRIPNQYEFFIECAPSDNITKVVEILKSSMVYCSVVSRNSVVDSKVHDGKRSVRWPPRRVCSSNLCTSSRIRALVPVADQRPGQVRESNLIARSRAGRRSSRIHGSRVQNQEKVFGRHRVELQAVRI